MFDRLVDIPSISWRNNEKDEDGLFKISKDLDLLDYVIFQADEKFFGTSKGDKYGGWITSLDTHILKFSATCPRNAYHGYKSGEKPDEKLHEIPFEVEHIKRYAILFRD